VTETAVQQQTELVARPARRLALNWLRELTLLPAIGALIVAGIVVSPAFFTTSNIVNVAQFSAALGTVVVAEGLILLTGNFDLSLESTYGIAPMIGAWLIVPKEAQGLGTQWSPALGILVVLAIGAAVGLFNGLLIVKARFNAFIFTLAMLILLRGIDTGLVSGRTVYHMPNSFIYLGSAYWGGVPVSVWVTGAIFAVAGLFLRYHRVGRAIYAIGGNVEAARAAGIKVDRIRVGVFTVAGLLAAIAGLMTTGQVVAVTVDQGRNLIFTVFAAAVIGGISLQGGRGRMIGALSGVVLLGLVQNVLQLGQVQTFWIDAANGAIILVALLLARIIGKERT
jgi:simple sugar transport system permease protein